MNDQNPYANDGMSGGYDEYAGPERTSALQDVWEEVTGYEMPWVGSTLRY